MSKQEDSPGAPNPNSVVGKGLSAIAELEKEQNEVGVLLSESEEEQDFMKVEAAAQRIELSPANAQEEMPATTNPGGQDLQFRYQSEITKYNRLKDQNREIESAKKVISSIPAIANYLRPKKPVSSAPHPISPVKGLSIRASLLATTKEKEEQGAETTTADRAKELDHAEQPATFEEIKTVLKACDGKADISEKRLIKRKAVDLWKQLRKSLGKKDTQKALEIHVGVDHSDFHKWLRCESKFPDGSPTEVDPIDWTTQRHF